MIKKFFRKFARDQRGATAIEYGMIAALIAVPIIAVLPGIGTKLETAFKTINEKLTPAATVTPQQPAGGNNGS